MCGSHLWLTLLPAWDTEHALELAHPRGKGAGFLPTNFHMSLVGCCSQECRLPRISAGTCHRKPPARSRASSVRYVDRALLPHRNLITTSPPRCPSLSPPNQTAPFLSTCPSHENMFPVPSASELPSLNIYQWVIVLLIGC